VARRWFVVTDNDRSIILAILDLLDSVAESVPHLFYIPLYTAQIRERLNDGDPGHRTPD
jgi:hypothetical protein